MPDEITYKSAGVDIDAGAESLRRIKERVAKTHNASVLTGLGSFGSLFDLSKVLKGYEEPVLVQSVDGVGTKLMVATLAGRHETIGIDIVNHCCNDILCQGAKPLTFLDYIAVESLDPGQVEQVISGMAKACEETGTALVGGETAELPGVYVKGEYDLAGIITGVVEKSKIIDGQNIVAGDIIFGLPSSGLHTNGYTLARKVSFEKLGLTVDSTPHQLGGKTVGEVLLEPHRDYSRLLWPLLQQHPVKGLAHITGGGLVDNTPRILPKNVDAVIEKGAWKIPALFTMIRDGGNVPESDIFRSLNMGVGMVIVIGSGGADSLKNDLVAAGETVYDLGEIRKGEGKTRLV
jgi:phosphoribosylformylglycinamidine cyclo-ligase